MEEKIITMMEKICESDELRDNLDVNLFDAGLMDSLTFIEFIVAVDKEFDIDVEPTEIQREDVETVNKVITFIKSRKGA